MASIQQITDKVVEKVQRTMCDIADEGYEAKDVEMITYNMWEKDPMYRVELKVRGYILAVVLLKRDLTIKEYRYF